MSGYAVQHPGGQLEPWQFERRDLRPDDVAVQVRYCGVCHSDLHALEGARPGDVPLVPGHEFEGVVGAVGEEVTRFRVGDSVAVGNVVDSCGRCSACRAHEEPYCAEFPTLTYGGTAAATADRRTAPTPPSTSRRSGSSTRCRTGWTPGRGAADVRGRHHLGALAALADGTGHRGRRGRSGRARSFGGEVRGGSRCPRHRLHHLRGQAAPGARARRRRGRAVGDPQAMARQAGRLDFVLDTASGKHDPSPYLRSLRMDGTLCMLGLPDRYEPEAMALLGRRNLTVSGSGGTVRTREMLEFCAEHQITADIEVLPLAEVGTTLERLARNDVRYRFVLDVAGA